MTETVFADMMSTAQAARQQAAERSVTSDPFVQALVKDFGAHVVPGSIRPGHAAL